MGSISLPRTALISIVVQGLVFGVFLSLFSYSQWVLSGQRQELFKKPLWVASVVMFLLAVTHLAVDSQRLMDAFLNSKHSDGGPAMFLAEISQPTFILKSTVYIVQTLIGDGCIIYRCFVVYQRSHGYLVIAFPLLLLASCTVSGCVLIASFAQAPPTSTIFVLVPWAVAYLILSLATNVICTTLIAVRIWRATVNRHIMHAGPHTLVPVLAIVIESGAIYSASLVAVVAVYLSQSWGHFIVLDSLSSIIGIVFTMIIITVHKSLPSESQGRDIPLPNYSQSSRIRSTRFHDQYAPKPLAVNVQMMVEEDRSYPMEPPTKQDPGLGDEAPAWKEDSRV